MTTSPLRESINALPAAIRQELDQIRAAGRGIFGRNQTQSIVGRHFSLLATLRDEYGATHADLAGLLEACGITCPDGKPLTAATLSSAMSRVKTRSARAVKRRPPQPPARNAPPSSTAKQPAEGFDQGKPPPGLAMVSTEPLNGQAVVEDAGSPSKATLLAPNGDAAGIRGEDHHTRLIELLSQMTED